MSCFLCPINRLTMPLWTLHIFQSSDFLFRTDAFVSECFYDDEQHGDEGDAEDGGDGRTENDGNPHSDSV